MKGLTISVPVLVAGAGAMGSGIAQVAALAGHKVFLYDAHPDAVERGKATIERDLAALVARGRLEAAVAQAAGERIHPVIRLEEARTAGLAIEAIVEDLAVKRELFVRFEELLAEDAILASNTSSLSVTALGAGLRRPGRIAGMHFFNPAPRMTLVEVVSGLATDAAVAESLAATATAWGKTAVHVRSTPGFIVNRVARPYYAEALRVLGEGAATPATLDAVLREACRFPMGPCELMDLIGHDVNFAVTRAVFDANFGDRRFQPSLIQQELVLAGRLGRKSGQGFYAYGPGAAAVVPDTLPPQPAPVRVLLEGEHGPAAVLAERMAAAGIAVERGPGPGRLRIGNTVLAPSDGRTATRRAADEGHAGLALFDLAFDYATTPRLAIACADQATPADRAATVGALQAAGIAVSLLDDVAGLIGLRTACMLANEAADAVTQGVASPADIDAAMRHGTNYPRGPLAWAEAIGLTAVVSVLRNLQAHYGEERYRISPWLQRRLAAGA
jgi:3-hydroxybutyryl-CoA dehydrogenase